MLYGSMTFQNGEVLKDVMTVYGSGGRTRFGSNLFRSWRRLVIRLCFHYTKASITSTIP